MSIRETLLRGFLSGACAMSVIFGVASSTEAKDQTDAAPVGGSDEKPSENPHLWKPRTTSVTVFKNGLGFFLREGKVGLRDGWCVAEEIPPAAFGTLMTYSHSDDEHVDVVGAGPGEVVEFDDRDAPDDIATRRSRLEASLHLKVELAYRHQGTNRTAAGKLVSVGRKFAILEANRNTLAVPIEGIAKMQLLDMPLRIHIAADDPAERPKETKLGMAYLRKGITWIPEYSLKVLDDESAELTLRGTVVNEAEDLIHCDLNLVVGVPHFVHQDYMTPIAVGQRIRTIGAAVAPAQVRGQIMNRSAMVGNSIGADQFNAVPQAVREKAIPAPKRDLREAVGNLPRLDGGAGSDFTVYTKSDLTLRRGEKAMITIFRTKIRYSHVYEWNTADRLEHFLVLQNDHSTAWTTGPCLAVSNGRPLSEDLLKYTPQGGAARLPVTTAVNVSHRKTEMEVDRHIKAQSSSSKSVKYDLVTLAGKIELRNFHKREAEIEIVNPVPGKPISASDDGEWAIDSKKLQLLEREAVIRWKIRIPPGESRTLTYQYERYVRSL